MQDLYLCYCHLCINHFYFYSLAVVSMLSNPPNWIICFKSKFALVDLLFSSDPKNGRKWAHCQKLPKWAHQLFSLSYVITIRAWNFALRAKFRALIITNIIMTDVLVSALISNAPALLIDSVYLCKICF